MAKLCFQLKNYLSFCLQLISIFKNHLLSINMFLRFFWEGGHQGKSVMSYVRFRSDKMAYLQLMISVFWFCAVLPRTFCLCLSEFPEIWHSFCHFIHLILLCHLPSADPSANWGHYCWVPPPQSSDWGVMLSQAASSQRCYLGISNHWVSHLDWKRGREGWKMKAERENESRGTSF